MFLIKLTTCKGGFFFYCNKNMKAIVAGIKFMLAPSEPSQEKLSSKGYTSIKFKPQFKHIGLVSI